MAIRGVTFPNQTVAAVDHGVLYSNIFTDGILSGCAISYSGSTITIAAGYLVVAGRLIQLTSSTTVSATAGGAYARLKCVIDTTLPSTSGDFQQVSFVLDYSSTATGFPALTQEDINNGGGNDYEAALEIFAMSGANVSSVYSGPFNATITATSAATATTASNATLAAKATQLATARNIGITDADGTNSGTAASFNGTSAVTIKLPSTIKATLTGNASGNAGTATKLATARTIRTNLASASTASFDGSANVTPGVTGTLPAANGGTGETTLGSALNALCNAGGTESGTPSDDIYYIGQSAGGTNIYCRRKLSSLFNYIKGKLTASDIPALPASKITSGTFGTAYIADGAITAAKIGSGAVTDAKIASGVSASKITGASSTLASYTARRIYIGTSVPGSSVGEQGDIYIVYS